MSVCVVIQSLGVVATGSDVTPGAIAFGDITGYRGSATTNTETIASTDTPVTLRATWTGDGIGYWVKNGVLQGSGISPLDVSVSTGDTLAFRMECGAAPASASGTVTVTNVSDAGAAVGRDGLGAGAYCPCRATVA